MPRSSVEVAVARRDVDVAGFGPVAVAGERDRQGDDAVQPGGEAFHEGRAHMLHDQDGQREVQGQGADHPGEGRRPAGGGGDRHDEAEARSALTRGSVPEGPPRGARLDHSAPIGRRRITGTWP